MSQYNGRQGFKETARLYPHVVEVIVPPGGFGRRIDDMHAFHRQRRIKDQHLPRRRDDEHDYIRWCFADRVAVHTWHYSKSECSIVSPVIVLYMYWFQ